MKRVTLNKACAACDAVAQYLGMDVNSDEVSDFIFYPSKHDWYVSHRPTLIRETQYELPDEIADRIEALAGPHSHTICKAIEARREQTN